MHINVFFCTFMPFAIRICNLNLWDELEDNGFQLFLDITNYHYKGNIFNNCLTNFINPSYNDITLCISLCVTRKQHITLGDRRGKFSAFYTIIKAAHLPNAEVHLLVSFSWHFLYHHVLKWFSCNTSIQTGWNIMKLLSAVILCSHLLVISHNVLCPQRELPLKDAQDTRHCLSIFFIIFILIRTLCPYTSFFFNFSV
jgi:hypothetical protein